MSQEIQTHKTAEAVHTYSPKITKVTPLLSDCIQEFRHRVAQVLQEKKSLAEKQKHLCRMQNNFYTGIIQIFGSSIPVLVALEENSKWITQKSIDLSADFHEYLHHATNLIDIHLAPYEKNGYNLKNATQDSLQSLEKFNYPPPSNENIFCRAVLHNYPRVVFAFLDHQLIPNDALVWDTKEGKSLGVLEDTLVEAAVFGHADIVRGLLDRGARVDAGLKENQWTPLMSAAYGGKTDVVKLLIERGANVHARSHSGETPLMMAVSSGNRNVLDTIQTLLKTDAIEGIEDMTPHFRLPKESDGLMLDQCTPQHRKDLLADAAEMKNRERLDLLP